MGKVVIRLEAGAETPDTWEYFNVQNGVTGDELAEFATKRSVWNAQNLGLVTQEEIDSGNISASIKGTWDSYNPYVHNQYAVNDTPDWKDYVPASVMPGNIIRVDQ